MTTSDAPPPRDRRYYFGWHLVNGIPFSMKWMEDKGIVVGGIPDVVGRAMEITEEEYNDQELTLADLEKINPFPENIPVKELTPPEEPEPI